MTSKQFKKILIIRLSSLGDVLLATPLLNAIKREYGLCSIDFVVRNEYADAIRLNPNVEQVFLYSRDKEEITAIKKKIKSIGYDLIIDLQNNPISRALTSGMNVKVVRFYKNSLAKFLLVKFKINRLKAAPSIPERYAATAEIQLNNDDKVELFIPGQTGGNDKNSGKKLIGLCPGARHFTKRWSKEYFIELGKTLIENSYDVCLLGGKDDTLLCEEIAAKIPGAMNFATDNDLYKLAFNMKRCSAVVCNDSGLMHIACGLKIPVVAIFGSTVKEFGFFPYKSKSSVLENNSLFCRPCSHIGRRSCPKKHFKCMNDITPVKVYKTLNDLICL